MNIKQHSMVFSSSDLPNQNWVRVGHSKYEPYDLL